MKPTPAEALPPVEGFYGSVGKDYWVRDKWGIWIPLNESSIRRHLRAHGLSPECPRDETLSEVEDALHHFQMGCSVMYAGPLAGCPAGPTEQCGNRILVTAGPKLIEPHPGNFPLLEKLLENLFWEPGVDQRPYVLGWLKIAIESLRAQHLRPGQALAMAGPKKCGKSLFQQIITELLGGRSAKAYRYMSEGTEFNGELMGAEHLMVEDDVAGKDIRARRTFGARIKDITVNQVQSCHAKHRQALSLRPFWRLSISLNDEPENLQILPPFDESVTDKIMLLRANKRDMPMPTVTPEQRDQFWNALMSELPAFVDHLLHWEIPQHLRCERFGITHYHDPELLADIDGMSPESKLLALIDAEVFNGPTVTTWTGSAEQLEKLLVNSGSGHAARRLLDWTNATGTYLGRLAVAHRERITQERTKSARLWTIRPPWVTR